MKFKNEAALRQRICKIVHETKGVAQPIESAGKRGIPDLYLFNFSNGEGLWVELKVIRGGGLVKVGGAQFLWHRKHAQAGGSSMVLVFNNKTGELGYRWITPDNWKLIHFSDLRQWVTYGKCYQTENSFDRFITSL
jgi:hypothetical protein